MAFSFRFKQASRLLDHLIFRESEETGLPAVKLTTCWSREGATLIGGQTCYFLFDGEGETTLTIAKTGDVEAYPVTVVQPEHGTVVAGFPEAPAGCVVFFSVVPDPGWDLYEVRATDSAGNALGVDSNADGSTLYARMPAGPLFLEVAFERDYRLVVGENPILFEPGMPDCSFVAPADGPYRFRSTGVLGPKVAILDSGINGLASDRSGDGNGNFDCVAGLEAGKTYWINVDYDGPAVEATIVVSRCAVHSVAVDGGVAHGRVAAVDEDGNPVSEALEGTRICHLRMDRYDNGPPTVVQVGLSDAPAEFHPILFEAEHSTVATNAAADGTELDLDYRDDRYSFTMPDSAVTVTATVGPPLPRYLDDADSEVVDCYNDWAARYGPDPDGTNFVAFLLDIDPATEIPAGAAPLKVTDFRVDGPFARFELGSDIADLAAKTEAGGDTGIATTFRVGNGILLLSFGEALSSTNEWTSVPLHVCPGENGRIVGEHITADVIEIGSGAIIGGTVGGGEISGVIGFGSEPPSGFFRPTLSTRLPPDYGQK